MRIAQRIATTMACALAGTALAGGTALASTDTEGMSTIKGTCGQTYSPTVPGGAAGWTLSCANGKIRVQGWVKDTRADGKGAEVYGTWGNGSNFGTVRAAGEGTIKRFNKVHSGSSVTLRLRVI
jgi:hypothetical protein